MIVQDFEVVSLKSGTMDASQRVGDRPLSIRQMQGQEVAACRRILPFAEVKQQTGVLFELRQELLAESLVATSAMCEAAAGKSANPGCSTGRTDPL